MPKILVIEDDDQIRTLIRKMLENETDYNVIEAADGNQGITQFKKHVPDLVITDIIMPDKEGIETIKDLRKEFSEVKIIAISGGGRIGPYDYLDLAKRLGASEVFEKPFDLKELVAAVKKLLTA